MADSRTAGYSPRVPAQSSHSSQIRRAPIGSHVKMAVFELKVIQNGQSISKSSIPIIFFCVVIIIIGKILRLLIADKKGSFYNDIAIGF